MRRDPLSGLWLPESRGFRGPFSRGGPGGVPATGRSRPGSVVSVQDSGAAPLSTETFESYTVGTIPSGIGNGWWTWLGANNFHVVPAISDTLARSGSKSFEWAYEDGGTDYQATGQFGFTMGGQLTELWLEYYYWLPTAYEHGDDPTPGQGENNKFLAIWGGSQANYDASVGTRPRIVIELVPRSGGSTDSSLRVLADTAVQGSASQQAIVDPMIGGGGPFLRNAWNRIRIHLKLGTPENGEYEIWVNDSLVFQDLAIDFFTGEASLDFAYFQQGFFMGAQNSGYQTAWTGAIDDVSAWDTNPGWS